MIFFFKEKCAIYYYMVFFFDIRWHYFIKHLTAENNTDPLYETNIINFGKWNFSEHAEHFCIKLM